MTNGPAIVIGGECPTWPDGPRTLTALPANQEPGRDAFWFGTRLTRNVVYDSVSKKFSVCTGLGLGIIASVVLLLGVFHLLMPGIILALFGISCVLLWPATKGLRRDAEGVWRNSSCAIR